MKNIQAELAKAKAYIQDRETGPLTIGPLMEGTTFNIPLPKGEYILHLREVTVPFPYKLDDGFSIMIDLAKEKGGISIPILTSRNSHLSVGKRAGIMEDIYGVNIHESLNLQLSVARCFNCTGKVYITRV